MTREEFVKQRCEIDKITEEEFKKQLVVVLMDIAKPQEGLYGNVKCWNVCKNIKWNS